MWEMYDQLIEEIPEDITVDHIHMGDTWTIVHAGPYCGFAVTVNEQGLDIPSSDYLLGKTLRSVASLCKSWNFIEASVGTAALNAFHNSPSTALSIPGMAQTKNAFTDYAADELSGLMPDYLPLSKVEEVGFGNVKVSAYGQRVRLQK